MIPTRTFQRAAPDYGLALRAHEVVCAFTPEVVDEVDAGAVEEARLAGAFVDLCLAVFAGVACEKSKS